MNEEAGFLRALADSPGDDATRLVYADWLEEHGHADRAAFVRAEVEFGEAAMRMVRHRGEIDRRRASLPADWVAAVKMRWQVVLTEAVADVERKKFVIKTVRLHTNVGLVEAKAIVENVPAVLCEKNSADEAARVATEVARFAAVEIRPA